LGKGGERGWGGRGSKPKLQKDEGVEDYK